MEATQAVIVRQYAGDDFMDVSSLLQEFHKEALKDYGLKCEDPKITESINIFREECLVLEMDNKVVGLIAGKVVDYPLQKSKLFQEAIWYVSKDYRRHGLKLLRELERRCKARGIKMVIMIAMGNSMAAKLDRLYKITGYRLLETHYIKVIE